MRALTAAANRGSVLPVYILDQVAPAMRLHGRECLLRLFVWNDRDDLAFVGKIKRIEPENLAKAPHLVAKRGRGLVDFDGKLRGLGNLVEDGRHAAAGGITDESRRRGSG
jgi:hypothetical protein